MPATGESAVVPDRLEIVLGISLARLLPGEALAELSTRLNALGGVLEEFAVPVGDRRTSELSLKLERTKEQDLLHRASSSVTVTMANFDAAADLVAAAGEAVSDGLIVRGLAWLVSDPTAGLEEARQAAVASGTRTASQLADAAGVTLGRLRSVREPPSGGTGWVAAAAAEKGGGRRSARLDAGESTIRVTVEMSWDIPPAPS